MKKSLFIIFAFIALLVKIKPSLAAEEFNNKWRSLGTLAGIAGACNSPALLHYEDIVGALMIIDSGDNLDNQYNLSLIHI